MRKLLVSLALAASALVAAPAANAAAVVVWGERFPLSTIDNFYDSLTGVTSTIASGTLDTVDLTGVGLLWAVQPADAYTAAELTTMAGFLAGGGRIAFMGEHGSFAPDENNRINTALSTLGATISITNNALSCDFRTAERATGEIKDHSLTTGVDLYQYACFAQLNVSGTAQVLMTGDTGSDGDGIPMMAYQNIGPGSVFLITDQNVWDGQPAGWPGYDNARMFENLLLGDTGAPPVGSVPEPATIALLGFGMLALPFARRRSR